MRFTEDGLDAIAVDGVATGVRSIGIRGEGEEVGLSGLSANGEGVHGETNSLKFVAIAARSLNPAGEGAALFAEKKGDAGHAGFFVGNVHVSRNLFVEGDVTLPNADFAEDFRVADPDGIEPGTVMILCDDETLQPSHKPYDKRVAGVVSGAGEYKPAIVLDKQPGATDRKPVALVGKVYCKVDASYAPVAGGDLLTTTPRSVTQ